MRYWCLRGRLQEADNDVIQEVFRAAFAALPDFRRDRPGDTFRGWLRVITRNMLALHFRRKGRVPSAPAGLPLTLGDADPVAANLLFGGA